MQILGLGAIAALLPLAVWGWRLMKSGELGRRQLRLALWVIGAGAATALASAMPATDRWPLPTRPRRRGRRRDPGRRQGHHRACPAALRAPSSASSSPVIAILSLSAACGLGLSDEPHRDEAEDFDDNLRPGARPSRSPIGTRRTMSTPDEPGWGIVSLGALAHGVMSLRVRPPALCRIPPGRSEDDDFAAHRELASGWRARVRAASRSLDAGAPRAATRPGSARRCTTRTTSPGTTGERAATPRRQRPEPPAARVAPVPSAPKPGKRMAREAQPSLLDEGLYQLPALTLLAEPKKPVGPIVSADALEQNAALLEGVLEDFGVKGEIIHVRPGPVVTLYELEPAPGIKSSRVIALAGRHRPLDERDLGPRRGRSGPQRHRHRAAEPQARDRLPARAAGKPRISRTSKQKLPLCLGKNIGGEPVIADLARMPHLLVAGTTGSGKSVGDQHHDPVAALPAHAGRMPPDHGRSRRCWNCRSMTASRTC